MMSYIKSYKKHLTIPLLLQIQIRHEPSNMSQETLDKDMDISELVDMEALSDYCEFNRDYPISIPSIHEMVGGSNLPYVCCHADQSEFAYKYYRNQIVKESDNAKYTLSYFQERQSPLHNAIFIVVLIPKTAVRRQQMVLLGCVQMTFPFIMPNIGYTRKFKIGGRY